MRKPFLRPRLARPRLLPLTIAAMVALFGVKSVILVQAAAEEPASLAGTPSPAQSTQAPATTTHTGHTQLVNSPTKPTTIPALNPPVSDGERAILLDLRRRHEGLDARTHALDEREAEIGAADRRLAGRVKQLAALQARLETLEAGRQQHSAENWAGLVKVYEAMKPREAAVIFDVLDMQVLLQVLDRMQERRAAPVLAAMQPDRARLATQLLAEMRTRAVSLPIAAPSPSASKG